MIRSILDFLLPRFCICCDRRLVPSERAICMHCLLELPCTQLYITPCENPMRDIFNAFPAVNAAAAFVWYHPKDPFSNIVKQYKYHDDERLAFSLGRFMAQEIQHANPIFFSGIDAIVPVPLTFTRLVQRGYNQSAALAQGVASVINVPVYKKALKRSRFKVSQTTLSRYERRENVSHAFSPGKDITHLHGKHILLIDDVITTGATTTACVETLQQHIPSLTITILSWAKTMLSSREGKQET